MQPKPGIKSTEFWVTIIIIAAASIAASLALAYPDNTAVTVASIVTAGLVTALTGAGYIISRTKVKDTAEKQPPAEEKVEEKVEEPPKETVIPSD